MTGFSGLSLADADADEDNVQWKGVSKILGPRWAQLPVLTIGLLGVQMLWSVEMAYASPYLMSLGLSKSSTAVAFLAGPLSGLLVQPLIGVIADNTKSSLGRRRPYMIGGTLICCVSMILLGFTRNITTLFSNSETLTIIVAVVALYGIDFSVNAVQATDRALIVDTLPFSQQPDGSAWAARMQGFGSVFGFFIGNVDLTSTFAIIGDSEIKVLAVLASSILLGTQLWTCFCVKEKVLISSSSAQQRQSLASSVKEIWDNLLTLPRTIRQICFIQSLAWSAWFPFLFYSTVYIGDLYKLSVALPESGPAIEELNKEATIIGTRASFYFSLVALTANFVLPLFTKEEKGGAADANGLSNRFPVLMKLRLFHICELWAVGHFVFASCMTATLFVHSVWGSTLLVAMSGFSWAMTQWAPFSLLGEEILASAEEEGVDETVSIRLTDSRSNGISTEAYPGNREVLWDENEEDANRDADESHRLIGNGRVLTDDAQDPYDRRRKDSGEAVNVPFLQARSSSFEGSRSSYALLSNPAARNSRADLHVLELLNGDGNLEGDEDTPIISSNRSETHQPVKAGGLVAKAGIIIGIHNLFVVFPQFISSGLAALIFAVVDPKNSSQFDVPENDSTSLEPFGDSEMFTHSSLVARADYDDGHGATSVVIIFRLGAIASFIAFFLSWRLARELKRR